MLSFSLSVLIFFCYTIIYYTNKSFLGKDLLAMKYTYIPQGVCSTKVDFEIEDGVVKNVSFLGGCNGNLKAISALVEGMPVDEVTKKLSGISCGMKSTSCTDQFATCLLYTSRPASTEVRTVCSDLFRFPESLLSAS